MKEITIYTDGSSEPNPGKGGYGAIILEKGKENREFSKGFRLTTNNRMELLAIIEPLEDLSQPHIINVFSDSQYVVNAVNRGWLFRWNSYNQLQHYNGKRINRDLWRRLLELINYHKIKFTWIRGHSGIELNERADELAGIGRFNFDLHEDYWYEHDHYLKVR